MKLRYSEVAPEGRLFEPAAVYERGGGGGRGAGCAVFGLGYGEVERGSEDRVQTGSEAVTDKSIITSYNNFYEFGTGKDEPVKAARNSQTSPWTVADRGERSRSRRRWTWTR